MTINKHLFEFVLNRPSLLNFLLKFSNFGKNNSLQRYRDKFIAQAIEGLYSAGETLESAEIRIKELEQKNIGVILNYAMEAAGDEGIALMEAEYQKILACLKNHNSSCVALKPTSLIPEEQIFRLCDLMRKENYCNIDLDKIMNNNEINEIAEPFSRLLKKATEIGTRILIDAEQSNLQPGVDLLALFLMKQFNKNSKAYIYNTYQLYLKDSPLRLAKHKEWIETRNSRFAAKIVRGAYLTYERSPNTKAHPNYTICNDKVEVDHNYNYVLRKLIPENKSSLVVATHNSQSIELLKSLVCFLSTNNVEYAYLMGFGDKIGKGTNFLRCLEYVPYGPSEVKIPYLLRRLEENINIFANKN